MLGAVGRNEDGLDHVFLPNDVNPSTAAAGQSGAADAVRRIGQCLEARRSDLLAAADADPVGAAINASERFTDPLHFLATPNVALLEHFLAFTVDRLVIKIALCRRAQVHGD